MRKTALGMTLIPFNIGENGSCSAHSLLGLDRCSLLWGAILRLPSHEIALPIGIMCCIEPHLLPEGSDGSAYITLDDYDKPLRYVLAADLLALADDPHLIYGPANKAAWAYLTYLNGDTKIALYWQ